MAERRLAAVDLGAGSGRVAVGRWDGETVELDVLHRFVNRPLSLSDGLHWNITQLFVESLAGLGHAASGGALDGVGVDSWGCDYALLDERQGLLGLPFHYRDPQRSDAGVMGRAHRSISRAELYACTGIQTLPFNTVFQLTEDRERLAAADRVVLIPDLFNLWLSGVCVNEATAASTTGMLDARSVSWAESVVERLGFNTRPFTAEVVPPGTELGSLLAHHADAGAAVGSPVRTVAGHDTASAFVAVPAGGPHRAILSSGTWSLLGVTLEEPCLGAEAAGFNLTNERGVGGLTRLLRNVMGMWLIEECRREWTGGLDYDEIFAAAREVSADVPLFDPDHPSLLTPGPMCERIWRLCRPHLPWRSTDRATLVRSILVSLACKYRFVLDRLQAVTGASIDTIQIIGGGARNDLLCQLTADITGREVSAGAVEATLLGNVLVQLLALDELSSLDDLHDVAARSAPARVYEPGDCARSVALYERFLDVTGLPVPEYRFTI